MKKIILIALLLILSGIAVGQQPRVAAGVKMPEEYSAKLSELQQQRDKLEKDYGPIVKEYVAKRDAIQAQAAVLITRAALAAHLTLEQLDNSEVRVDDKGNYQWVPKPKPESAKTAPK